MRGDLPGRQPAGACGTTLDADRPGDVRASTRASSTGRPTSTTIHLPSIVAARPRQDHARQDDAPTAPDRLRRQRARPRAPRRRVRPREHADRQSTSSRATRGWPPAGSTRPSGCATSLRTLAEAPGLLSSSTARDRGDFLRHFYRRYEDAPVDQIDEDAARAAHPADPHQELPGRHPPGARAPRRSGTARS